MATSCAGAFFLILSIDLFLKSDESFLNFILISFISLLMIFTSVINSKASDDD